MLQKIYKQMTESLSRLGCPNSSYDKIYYTEVVEAMVQVSNKFEEE